MPATAPGNRAGHHKSLKQRELRLLIECLLGRAGRATLGLLCLLTGIRDGAKGSESQAIHEGLSSHAIVASRDTRKCQDENRNIEGDVFMCATEFRHIRVGLQDLHATNPRTAQTTKMDAWVSV